MDKFDRSLPMMLHRTLDSIIPKYRTAFNEHGISEQQWRILRVLWEENISTTSRLAKKTLLPAPSMVGFIDRMFAKGLLKRKRDTKDRRVVYVSLTDLGEALLQTLIPKIDNIYEQIISHCDSNSWSTMIDTMQTIIDMSDAALKDDKTNKTNKGLIYE